MNFQDVPDLINIQKELAIDLMNQTSAIAFMFEKLVKHSEICCDDPLLGVAVTLRQMESRLGVMFHELDLCIDALREIEKEEAVK